jgi:hypothetical protein
MFAASCSVCAMLLVVLQRWDLERNGKVDLQRTRSALTAGPSGPRLLRFSVDPGQHLFSLSLLLYMNLG